MTQRTTWFRCCMECNSTAPNRSGICDQCAVTHGYANDNRAPVQFSDDVQPDQRERKEDL
ncbi:hypothetical protein [Sphingobium abikonense]|jgi:predicted ATP-dependent serine protease|uniref:hypothetical protein n=1 Tax=Sphingobium abikonense TaxID=86193 RepID=UPI0035182887